MRSKKGLVSVIAAAALAHPAHAAIITGTSGDSIPDVWVDGRSLLIDPDGAVIATYSIESALGIFTGDAATGEGQFQADTDSLISGAYLTTRFLAGPIDLGPVIGTEWVAVDLLSDLTVTFNSLFIRGDVNRSGAVTTFDLVLMSRVILGITLAAGVDPLYSVMGPAVFDVDDSGSLTTLDIITARRSILGIDPPLTLGTDPTPDPGDGRISGTLIIGDYTPVSVPEPGTLALLGLGLAGLGLSRRKAS